MLSDGSTSHDRVKLLVATTNFVKSFFLQDTSFILVLCIFVCGA